MAGTVWDLRVAKVGGRVADLSSLSCPTPATCLSVGNGWTHVATAAPGFPYISWGAVERSSDGGRTWDWVPAAGSKQSMASPAPPAPRTASLWASSNKRLG